MVSCAISQLLFKLVKDFEKRDFASLKVKKQQNCGREMLNRYQRNHHRQAAGRLR